MIAIPDEVHPDVGRLASPTTTVIWTVHYHPTKGAPVQSRIILSRAPLAEEIAADLLAAGAIPTSIHPTGWATTEPL